MRVGDARLLLDICENLHYYSAKRFTKDDFPFIENLWILLARQLDALQIPGFAEASPLPRQPAARFWTDEHSDIFRLIH